MKGRVNVMKDLEGLPMKFVIVHDIIGDDVADDNAYW